MVLRGTAGYCWVLLGTGGYWTERVLGVHRSVLSGNGGGTGEYREYRVVQWSTVGYRMVLLGTAGNYWVLLGTAGYWGYWVHIGGRREVPQGTGATGGSKGYR